MFARRAFATLLLVIVAGCGGQGEPAQITDIKYTSSEVDLRREPVLSRAMESPAAAVEVDAPTGFSGHGWYWNPAEGGTGFFFEAQGRTGFAAFFLYDDAGNAIWYAASGVMTPTLGGYSFEGTTYRYSGGQPAAVAGQRTPAGNVVGPVSIAFTGDGAATNAVVSLPGGRQMQARRFSFGLTGAGTDATSGFPETGWYWDPNGGGRGWAIEVQGGDVFMVMYHYNADGSPTWNTLQGPLATGALTRGFNKFRGGQTLTGSYRAATQVPADTNYTLTNGGLCSVRVTYPGLATQALQRFKFGRVGASGECRSSYLTSLSSPEAGSTAAVGNGLEGLWFGTDAKETWGMVAPEGDYYFTGTSGLGMFVVNSGFTLYGITVPPSRVSSDTRYWLSGYLEQTGSATWNAGGSRHLEVPYGTASRLTTRDGSGAWVRGQSLTGTVGSAKIASAYSLNNARALDVSSLQGQWTRANNSTITVSFDGVVSGVQTSGIQGQCDISGRIQSVSVGSLKNLFRVDLTYSRQPMPSGTSWCTYPGTFSMLGSVLRVVKSDTDSVLVDSLHLQGWSTSSTFATSFHRR